MAELLDRKRISRELKSWLDDVASYEKRFNKWESRSEKIIKRFLDEQEDNLKSGSGQARFNILWSNVQTLKAATFSRLPKPDVSRRFKDQDPVGRVAALILERALEYEINHYPDYRATLDGAVLDRFLGGRGTAWVRYEPHMREVSEPEGVEVTEDVDAPQEELDYECAPTDYVHWRDFGHTVARTWEEVPRVWRIVYMRREQLVERFGEEVGNAIPLDAAPEEIKQANRESGAVADTAAIYEGWDKTAKEAVWFNKSIKDLLDVRPDPLKLEEFFPCPRPLYATLANDSLVPTPDYTLYQDQARELDILCDRIDGLVKALKVAGCYDASNPTLARIFTEGQNTSLFPVKNWAAFAEKMGLKGAIDLVDLKPIVEALKAAYEAMAQIKQQVYEITGISDIIRGNTEASETATAQQIKGQYASLRLKDYQNGVAKFSTEMLQLKAQVICNKFEAKTLALIGGVKELSQADQQYVDPALQLLLGPRFMDPESEAPNPLRSFRIEVASDSMVFLDEQAEKEARVEFLTATGGFLEKTAMALQNMNPQVAAILVPLLMEMLKFGVTGFGVGKSIEGVFDIAAQQMAEFAKTPQATPPDPKAMEEQITAKVEQQYAMKNAAKDVEHNKRAADLDIREMKFGAKMQVEKQALELEKREAGIASKEFDMKAREAEGNAKAASERASFDEERAKIAKESVSKVEKDDSAKIAALEAVAKLFAETSERNHQMMAQVAQALAALSKPKKSKIVRGADGRATHVETA